MEALLDQADALVQAAAAAASSGVVTTGDDSYSSDEAPDFAIPEEYVTDQAYLSKYMAVREDHWKGRGWFAVTDIPAGTLLLTAKPIAMVMDWQDDDNDDGDVDDDDDPEDTNDNMEEEEEHNNSNGNNNKSNNNKEPRLNELLLLEILQKLREEPALWWDKLSTLFPRDDSDLLSTLPAWVCHNDDVFLQVESLLDALTTTTTTTTHSSSSVQQQQPLPVKEIAKRLPLILRYNILSMETCAELLSYPHPVYGHCSLAGVGLYHWPSFFNHYPRPNVARWCVGDVMGFVTNQNVAAGTELCISYVEHDVLCEPAWRRNMMLSMDFTDHDDDAAAADDDNNNDVSGGTLENSKNSKVGGVLHRNKGPDMPVVDSDVQNELMSMDPFARLSAIDELMLQAVGEKRPENEQEEEQIEQGSAMEMTGGGGGGDSNDNGNDSDIIPWFQCDVHNLRILKAITLDGLGQTADALKLWEESVAFVEQKLPPLDESLVVLRAQAALCAWQAPGSQAVARHHAASALQAHCLLFGGGVARFRRRLDRDLNLALRPTAVTGSGGGDDSTPSSTVSPADILWPVVS